MRLTRHQVGVLLGARQLVGPGQCGGNLLVQAQGEWLSGVHRREVACQVAIVPVPHRPCRGLTLRCGRALPSQGDDLSCGVPSYCSFEAHSQPPVPRHPFRPMAAWGRWDLTVLLSAGRSPRAFWPGRRFAPLCIIRAVMSAAHPLSPPRFHPWSRKPQSGGRGVCCKRPHACLSVLVRGRS